MSTRDWSTVRAWAVRAVKRGAVLAIPLILVNAFAVYGQALWALDNLTSSRWVAIAFATALESIGLFLAAEAHSALMAGDAALRLRLASYAVAGLVGGLNYSHWAPGWHATPKAVTFAALSTVSPWLWAIRSRSMHRAELRAKGLIDPRTVRFAMARWVLYPWSTFVAFRRAVWVGETDPKRAAALAAGVTEAAPAAVTEVTPESRGVDEATAPISGPEPLQPAPVAETPTVEAAPASEPRKAAPAAVSPHRAEIQRLHRAGIANAEIARRLGVSTKTVGRNLTGEPRLAAVPSDRRTGS